MAPHFVEKSMPHQIQTTMSTDICVTHSSNKNTHPGMPDFDDEVLSRPIPKPRWTKAQIAADNAAAAAKKSMKAEEAKSKRKKGPGSSRALPHWRTRCTTMNSRPKERQSILLQKKWSWSHSNLLKV
jgi:hypothetical protein